MPTSGHRWLIAADWLEEEGAEVEAAAIRDGIWKPEDVNHDGGTGQFLGLDGFGHGNGCGRSEGWADGAGGTGMGERSFAGSAYPNKYRSGEGGYHSYHQIPTDGSWARQMGTCGGIYPLDKSCLSCGWGDGFGEGNGTGE